MNYQRIYEAFIADRREREAAVIESGVYVERHHITPRSLGGGDEAENIVALTAGDHFFAHLCLAKVHGGNQWAAVWALSSVNQLNSRKRDKLWVLRRRKWVSTSLKKKSEINKLPEIRAKISATLTGRPRPPEVREKIRAAQKGRAAPWAAGKNSAMKHSEVREKISQAQRGKPRPRTTGGRNGNAKALRCVETGGIFPSAAEAATWCALKSSRNMGTAIRTNGLFGGYHWEYVS
jgi:hypothetical protein